MQETELYADKTFHREHSSSRQRSVQLITAILPVLIVGIVVGSLAGLQWAGQRGITLGYPLPQVQITAPATGTLIRNQSYQFSAKASGRELSYFWDFGDQSTGSGASVSHAYQSSNTFIVTVTVTDAAGHQATQSDKMTVVPPAPQALFTYSAGFNNYIYFDASGSVADSSTYIENYNWNFGDGSATDTTSYSQDTHYYSNAGTYQATLIVTDATGQVSSPYTVAVTISQQS